MRQVTINSPERGLLLLRVRDEIRMTVDAYKVALEASAGPTASGLTNCSGVLPPQALYDSSVTFGMRKQLQAEQGIPEMESRIEVRDDARGRGRAKLILSRGLVSAVAL